jgi:hypothetical protein
VENEELLASSTSSSGETVEVYRKGGMTSFTLRRSGAGRSVSWARSWKELLDLLFNLDVETGVTTDLAWKLFTRGVCKAG